MDSPSRKVKNKKMFYLKSALIIWLTYFFITGILLFIKPKSISSEYLENSSVKRFYSDKIGPDRAILIDDPMESGLARLKIIGTAKETLNISYYSIRLGETSDLFFAALLDAADRGVRVNLLLDGVFNGIKGDLYPIIYTFMLHPNMELKFYEPFNIFMPWTINNRMHDKYIIADNTIGIIGGRNIGDRYFAPNWHTTNITNDRDVIIVNTQANNPESVINDMTKYFNEIWQHKYSKSVNKNIFNLRKKKAIEKYEELRAKYALAKEENATLLNQSVDFMEISFPTNKISLINNPITRFTKEPWCWYEITQLMSSAKESIFIQSPYVIPNWRMIKDFLDLSKFMNIETTILTNSLVSTPNIPAYAGYLNYRKRIIDKGINVLEYQSKDSLHTKAFAFDNDLLAIGTFNTDPRSAFLSTESMVIIHSTEGVKRLADGLKVFVDDSLAVGKDYNYIPRQDVNELPVSNKKKLGVALLAIIVRLLSFLL